MDVMTLYLVYGVIFLYNTIKNRRADMKYFIVEGTINDAEGLND